MPELSTGHSSQQYDWKLSLTTSTVLHGTPSYTKTLNFLTKKPSFIVEDRIAVKNLYLLFFLHWPTDHMQETPAFLAKT